MGDLEFDALARFVGSLQANTPVRPRTAEYERQSSDGMLSCYQVDAYVTGLLVRASSAVTGEVISYDFTSGRFELRADGETHIEESREFPISPPVLCLVVPQFLPIWGGKRSFYVPFTARELEHDRLWVEFGASEEEPNGTVVIDLEDGVVDDLVLNGTTFTRVNPRSQRQRGEASSVETGVRDFGSVGEPHPGADRHDG